MSKVAKKWVSSVDQHRQF